MSRRNIIYIIIVLFIGISSYLTIRWRMKLNVIKKDHYQTVGVIDKVEVNNTKYPGVTVYFTYYSSSKEYHNKEKYINLIKNKANNLVGHRYTILYQKSNPHNSKILLNKDDYDLFNKEFPDTLSWINAYFD